MLRLAPQDSSPVLPALPGGDRLFNNELSPDVLRQNASRIDTLVKGDSLHQEGLRDIRVVLPSGNQHL